MFDLITNKIAFNIFKKDKEKFTWKEYNNFLSDSPQFFYYEYKFYQEKKNLENLNLNIKQIKELNKDTKEDLNHIIKLLNELNTLNQEKKIIISESSLLNNLMINYILKNNNNKKNEI